MSFAVLACLSCKAAWAADLRHASSTCPSCRTRAEVRGRRFLWQGEKARTAQEATGAIRIQQAGGTVESPRPARHDSPLDAAAAKGRAVANKSQRAEAVASWLQLLGGTLRHGELVEALQRAGIDQDRAEAEVTRMLAVDILMEPRSGEYRVVA